MAMAYTSIMKRGLQQGQGTSWSMRNLVSEGSMPSIQDSFHTSASNNAAPLTAIRNPVSPIVDAWVECNNAEAVAEKSVTNNDSSHLKIRQERIGSASCNDLRMTRASTPCSTHGGDSSITRKLAFEEFSTSEYRPTQNFLSRLTKLSTILKTSMALLFILVLVLALYFWAINQELIQGRPLL